MRESQQSASMWTDEEPRRQGSNTELVAYLEAENSMLRDRALKLTSQIRALREALGDVLQHGRQGDAANRSLIEVERQLQAGEPRSVIGRTDEKKVEELLSYSRDPTGW